MIGLIAVVSSNGIMGRDNKLPFNYPEDMKWFRKCTINSVVVMGKNTFESMGSKPLPKRENIVITSSKLDVPGVRCYSAIEQFWNNERILIRDHSVDYWFIGGASIYEEGMKYTDKIYLTLTPDVIEGTNLVRFPWVNPLKFDLGIIHSMNDLVYLDFKSNLMVAEYYKR